jgi:hypothetical protein
VDAAASDAVRAVRRVPGAPARRAVLARPLLLRGGGVAGVRGGGGERGVPQEEVGDEEEAGQGGGEEGGVPLRAAREAAQELVVSHSETGLVSSPKTG